MSEPFACILTSDDPSDEIAMCLQCECGAVHPVETFRSHDSQACLGRPLLCPECWLKVERSTWAYFRTYGTAGE